MTQHLISATKAHRYPRMALGAAGVAGLLLVTACAPQENQNASDESPVQESSFAHVHGMAVDPETDQLLVATHNGLFTVEEGTVEQVGPVNDLMGFAADSEGRYYASGHPGPGSDLPNPVGLIESNDGGKTWQELSRQGESDFHAMAVSEEGVIGFDGTLRISVNGQEWTEAGDQIQPANLAALPDSPVVLATTQEGVQRSEDGGYTWTLPKDAPVLLMTAFADADTAVGVAPDGEVHISRDAGLSWEATGGTATEPGAITAAPGDEDVRIWIATAEGVEFSDDSGASFSTLVEAGEN